MPRRGWLCNVLLLAVTRRTADVRIDVQFFSPLLAVGLSLFFGHVAVEIELRDKLGVTNVRLGVAMAVQAELHRQRFLLRDNFHFVDATMTRNTTDTAIDVNAVIEINKIGQVVNSLPQDRFLAFEAQPDRLEQRAFGVNDPQVTLALGRPIAAVAISTSCRRRNCRMRGFFNRVVTIPAIQFQLTRVQFVTERNGLFRLMSDVHNRGMDRGEQTRR